MKKDLRRSVPKLELRNGTYEGGFGLLPATQLLKLKGGVTNTCPTNVGCIPPPANNCLNFNSCKAIG